MTTACLLAAAFSGADVRDASGGPARSIRYEDLVSLFAGWRSFQKPKLVDGVPDYSAPAMAAQHRELVDWQRRLAAIDPGSWPIGRQVDYHVVRAEMNGLDFDHRVLKPWARNPAFYVTLYTDESDQPAREGPFASGGVELHVLHAVLPTRQAPRLFLFQTCAARIRRRAMLEDPRQRRQCLDVVHHRRATEKPVGRRKRRLDLWPTSATF